MDTFARPVPRRFRTVERVLKDNWSSGRLTFALPGGREIVLRGHESGPNASMVVHDYRFIDRIFSRGLVGFGEGFMAGEWDSPDLSALLVAFSCNLDQIGEVLKTRPMVRFALGVYHRLHANTRRGSKRNIEAHYDLGNDFYSLWLDRTMTYSAARYDKGARTLAEAQEAKYAALARLMDLKSGMSVLEIGCGWGGFAEFAAKEIGAKVTGITLSPSQLEFARARMQRAGLSDKVDLRLVDYRDVKGQYDRVASIEMFEAVGEAWWPTYFKQVHDLLKPGGVAGLQIITIREDLFADYRRKADFIQRYIFPGGMLPTESRLRAEIAQGGLEVRTVEHFADDYGDTLREWRETFEARASDITAAGFDARFSRMWRFYLAYCEAGFRTRRTDVGQWAVSRA